MNRFFEQRILRVTDINERVERDPQRMIVEECTRYLENVRRVTEHMVSKMTGRCLVLLSGPSSAGKTTTANNLKRELEVRGRQASIISLDDFYRGKGLAPRLPDGSFDYESIEALDLPQLQTCMKELLTNGVTLLPRFDFNTREPDPEKQELRIADNSVVIFEGIHALNPMLEDHLPGDNVFKIFINVMSRVYDDEDTLLTRRDLRLCRRMLRDYQFRSSSIENTLDMWRQVVRGENLYMFPYVDTANAVFDTTHAFESAMLAPRLLPLLHEVPADSPYAETVDHLINALSKFRPLSSEMLPADALLREFVGP
ncbi:MAG: nucleoside kinase [Clostridia bacterium]|nr:nucleoside kinase [Clostridia bacterium]